MQKNLENSLKSIIIHGTSLQEAKLENFMNRITQPNFETGSGAPD